MEKLFHSRAVKEDPIVFYSGKELIKTASNLREDVARYIETIEASNNTIWILVHAIGAGEVWGCFPSGTLVNTPQGFVPIEDLEAGNAVFTHKGRERKVVERSKREHVGGLISLQVSGKESVEMTPNHPVLCVKKKDYKRFVSWKDNRGLSIKEGLDSYDFSPEFIRADEISPGDFVLSSVETEEVVCEELLPHAKALGYYLAEGCTAPHSPHRFQRKDGTVSVYRHTCPNRMIFVVSSEEKDALIIEDLEKWASDNGRSLWVSDYKQRTEGHKSLRLEVSFSEVASLAVEHCGSGAATKYISGSIKKMPLEWKREFLAAYFNGDGHQTKGLGYRDGALRTSTVSRQLAYDLQDVLLSMGVVSSVHSRVQHGGFGSPNRIWEISIGSSQLRVLALEGTRFDFESYRNRISRSETKLWRDQAMFRVAEVSHVEWSGTVHNIEVEEDNTYQVLGLSVHNSNRNGDLTLENALNHVPAQWTGNPELDKAIAKGWPYGWPTYYNAHFYANHCFPGYTQITMCSGEKKPIDEVKRGDAVLTHKGRYRTVEEVYSREYSGGMIKLYGPALGTLQCTPEHPILVIKSDQLKCHGSNRCTPITHANSYACEARNCKKALESLKYDKEWVRAEEVEEGDFVLFVPHPECSGKVDERFAWLLGLFMSEGSFVYSEGRLTGAQLTLGVSEGDLSAELEKTLSSLRLHYTGPYKHKANNTLMYVFDQDGAHLFKHYIEGRYSHERSFRGEVFSWSTDLKKHLLGGMLDGDGHQYKRTSSNSGTLRVRSTSYGLLEDIKELALSAHISAAVSWDTPDGKKIGEYLGRPSGVVRIGRMFSKELSQYALKVSPVEPKKRCTYSFPYGGLEMLQVTEISREHYSGHVYNLKVDEDNSYVAEGVAVHNCNKDPNKRVGDVAFVTWDPVMKRVELILRLDRERAERFGGSWALKRMDRGDPVDVSMGMRVPFDLSETETDWAKYEAAVRTYDPKIHKSPGQAVLMYHRRDPIYGLSITRRDYTPLAKTKLRQIMPDGQRICVRNTFPKFFDISLVVIGAERPAKLLWKMASRCEASGTKCASCKGKGCDNKCAPSGALVYERAEKLMKTASSKQGDFNKRSMDKDVPSNFNPKSVASVAESEESLPRTVLREMARRGPEAAFSTSSLMGIKLRPEEFQRLLLTLMGSPEKAEELTARNIVFGETDEKIKTPDIHYRFFSPALSQILQRFMPMRSGYEPYLKVRMVKVVAKKPLVEPEKSLDGDLQKVSAAYNDYCDNIKRNFIKQSALLLRNNSALRWEIRKSAGMSKTATIIGDLTQAYLGIDGF